MRRGCLLLQFAAWTIPHCPRHFFLLVCLVVCHSLYCACSCLSPPSSGGGVSYHVIVSVGGSPSLYSKGQWVYDAPRIDALTPLWLHPDPNTTLVVVGANFGTTVGIVTVADHTASCFMWTDDRIECAAPRGVVASATVRVTAASGQASATTTGAVVQYKYVR